MQVQPYLFFAGRCEEALGFYQQVLNAKLLCSMRFKDAPEDAFAGKDDYMAPEEMADKIMHATLQLGENSVIMCSDGDGSASKQPHSGYALSLSPATVNEARHLFDKLAAGGTVIMPFSKTFWALGFGMLRDKFGVQWMVNVEAPHQ